MQGTSDLVITILASSNFLNVKSVIAKFLVETNMVNEEKHVYNSSQTLTGRNNKRRHRANSNYSQMPTYSETDHLSKPPNTYLDISISKNDNQGNSVYSSNDTSDILANSSKYVKVIKTSGNLPLKTHEN